ncbi:phosphoglycerate mutase-like protein [Durotheca rogersii]|uniref:phosphoglycerate mutase-like protein n=1 Tax=Durotheca rogersii TaxID=419775 RepID=UPI0022203910|nr:phosphoglycerate mutase-like protein [Durotheca rogersii]KAI5861856.1 phosphoglycerate mutase-like protein [Durotheca rogersii]
MAPVVILIRHGEALHNILHDWELPDPDLTEKGVEQCKALMAELEPNLPFAQEECRIVVSPLRRTLQTVHHGLQWLRDRGVPVEVRAEWQETTDNPCDIGREPSSIMSEWPDFDFSGLDPIYPQKIDLYENSEEAFQKRASLVKRWLFRRPEKCVVVVTHSGFLKRVVQGPKFRNVEYRMYELVEGTEDLELSEISRGKASAKQT